MTEAEPWPYVWVWKARLPERRGQRFRVLARGALNACLVEFQDGARFITSRNALRRWRPGRSRSPGGSAA